MTFAPPFETTPVIECRLDPMLRNPVPDGVTISQSCILPDLELRKTIYEDGCELSRHAHEEPRFVVVLQGIFSEVSEHEPQRICKPSTLLFRPAGQLHANRFQNGRATCLTIGLGPSWLNRFIASTADWSRSLLSEGATVSRLALDLQKELYQPDTASSLAIESIVLELAVQTQRLQKTESSSKSTDWLKRAMDLIHAKFLESMTVKSFADAVEIHPVHFVRTFRRHYGCTPGEYIRKLRIRYASELMLSTEQSLVDVALMTGFCDQSHFSRLFKRYVGTSPAKFRKDGLRRVPKIPDPY